MNSKQLNNVIDSVIFNPVSHRDSFGLIDENGKRYTDIKKAFLHARKVYCTEIYKPFFIKSPSEKDPILYKIQLDGKTRKKIKAEGFANCLISFQQRTDGNFAFIRLFEKEEKK